MFATSAAPSLRVYESHRYSLSHHRPAQPGPAATMAIPGAREVVPLPLPPPRYIGDLGTGQDPAWPWVNPVSPSIDTGFAGDRLATVRPGSSLYGTKSSSRALHPSGSKPVTNGVIMARAQSGKEEERTSFGRQLPYLATSETTAESSGQKPKARLTPEHGPIPEIHSPWPRPLAAAKLDTKSNPLSDRASQNTRPISVRPMPSAQEPEPLLVVGQQGRRSHRLYHPPIIRNTPKDAEENVRHSDTAAKYSSKRWDPNRRMNCVSKKRFQYTISQDSTVETAQHSKKHFFALWQNQSTENRVSKCGVPHSPYSSQFSPHQGKHSSTKTSRTVHQSPHVLPYGPLHRPGEPTPPPPPPPPPLDPNIPPPMARTPPPPPPGYKQHQFGFTAPKKRKRYKTVSNSVT
ncbi:hypothetical protein FB567DRAFT_542985 [Paraphoma chrysanthemicola]|uniref:Uncharacterized protein n=1 Tax=Paraphoma chrysanthemicola TaxID=798071 RepID=A0A8K0RHE0_9PLEO|nr:hypothetical protein FB567DRAFT_542985 [Paraphoma chrysanthemicola]